MTIFDPIAASIYRPRRGLTRNADGKSLGAFDIATSKYAVQNTPLVLGEVALPPASWDALNAGAWWVDVQDTHEADLPIWFCQANGAQVVAAAQAVMSNALGTGWMGFVGVQYQQPIKLDARVGFETLDAMWAYLHNGGATQATLDAVKNAYATRTITADVLTLLVMIAYYMPRQVTGGLGPVIPPMMRNASSPRDMIVLPLNTTFQVPFDTPLPHSGDLAALSVALPICRGAELVLHADENTIGPKTAVHPPLPTTPPPPPAPPPVTPVIDGTTPPGTPPPMTGGPSTPGPQPLPPVETQPPLTPSPGPGPGATPVTPTPPAPAPPRASGGGLGGLALLAIAVGVGIML